MQTLLPTPNNLAPTRTDGLQQRPDPSPITSQADGSSFTQVMKQTQRSDPPDAAAGDQRARPDTTGNVALDPGESKPTSTDQPARTRGEPSTDEPATGSTAPVQGRSTPADAVERPAQNEGVSAQDLPADSAVSDEVNVAKEPVGQINPAPIEFPAIPNFEVDAAGVERSDDEATTTASDVGSSDTSSTPEVTTESTPATSTPLEAAPAPNSEPHSVDGAPSQTSTPAPNSEPPAVDGARSQTSTPVPNETVPASRIGVVDDRTPIGTDIQVTAGSSPSGAEQSNVATETGAEQPASDSTRSLPNTTVRDDTAPPPSPSPDQSGNGQVLAPSAVSGERGGASHEARPLDIDRAPQNGGRLQSPVPQSQSETSQDSRSNEGQSQPRSDQPDRSTSSAEPTSRAPASARAVQIDAAVRVENATGQPVPVQLTAALPAESLLPTKTTAGPVKELPTPSTPTRSADPSNDPFTSRILRGLSATLNQRGGVLTMRLDPPHLGQLRIQMTITQGTVSAEFQTSTPQAQALLERSLAVLRSALQGHGLTVERLTVHTTPQANAQVMRQDSPEQQARQDREQPDAGKGESRGRRDGDQFGSSHRYVPRPTGEYTAFDVSPQPAGAD